MDEKVKINPADVPNWVFEVGCQIISKSIRKFYEDENNRRGYEEWLKTTAGQRANLSKEERRKFDEEYVKKRGSETAICAICGKTIYGYGNSAAPIANGECCNDCNFQYVVPARLNSHSKQ